MITVVTTYPARANRAVTAIRQFRHNVGILIRYILSLFSKEKEITSLILRAHISSANTPTRPQLYSVRPFYHTDNYPLSVFSTTFVVVLCAVSPSTTQAIVLCQSFLFILPIDSYAWKILSRHHTGASNLKGVFSCMCSDSYHPEGPNHLWLVRSTVSRFLSTINTNKWINMQSF